MTLLTAAELWLQFTAGQGPAECALAVVKLLDHLQREATQASLTCRIIELEPGPEPGTAQSALVSLSGPAGALHPFAKTWTGTLQWIARSPFRPAHKRKNWFVGVDALEPVDEARPNQLFRPADLKWETMRASGPGGQHVNRTESAVRVTHLPTGLQATAAEERSQHRNRKLALARLHQKLAGEYAKRTSDTQQQRWRAHQDLERGNPVRIFRDDE